MQIIEEFWYFSAAVYSRINPLMIRHFRIDKVGYFLRKLKRQRTLRVERFLFQFEPEVATCFGRMIGGRFNEGETHKFLTGILDEFGKIDLFVDVGSNIGEFVIDMASQGKVDRVIGFEPNTACVNSSMRSIELNGLKNVEVRQLILKDSKGEAKFDMRGENAHLHSIIDPPSESELVIASTLDDEIPDSNTTSILLIDVEGAEVLVMKGGRSFIASNLPLIIFEYNNVSKMHFSLVDVRGALPAGYEIFRLRMGEGHLNGFLDRNLNETYNCVAVHKDSPFYLVAQKLIR